MSIDPSLILSVIARQEAMLDTATERLEAALARIAELEAEKPEGDEK